MWKALLWPGVGFEDGIKWEPAVDDSNATRLSHKSHSHEAKTRRDLSRPPLSRRLKTISTLTQRAARKAVRDSDEPWKQLAVKRYGDSRGGFS